MYYIGLMSGTSADGIDAVLASFPGDGPPQIKQAISAPFPDALRQEIFSLSHPGDNEIVRMGELDHDLANAFAGCVNKLLNKSDIDAEEVDAIGSHGQTLRHHPNNESPFSLQIGNPSLIAELTGIPTVADFRARDIAAGGQGAPLVPAFHADVFRSHDANRVIVNIGGIANLTILPAESDHVVTGFDTGPGNTLLDLWVQKHKGLAYDDNGAWSAKAEVEPELLAAMLSDPYFEQEPPKSTGKEYFNQQWLEHNLARPEVSPSAAAVQATLAALTADSITGAIKTHAAETEEVYVCGGGGHNKVLMESLATNLAPIKLATTAELGIDPDWVEALAFAWLAKQTIEGKAGNLPSVTGAKHPVILGGIYKA
jgi:anhydro-N-acetylmuramic acid kinase